MELTLSARPVVIHQPLSPRRSQTPQRTIVGFHQDEEGNWVAELDCHHNHHMRHDPPLINRAWVLSGPGRLSRLGQQLTCGLCTQLAWPDDLVPYQRTAEFTDDAFPVGLRKNHTTKKGVWAKIVILEGSLRYVVDDLDGREYTLTPTQSGIIPPQTVHHIEPIGPVRFSVEFYHQP